MVVSSERRAVKRGAAETLDSGAQLLLWVLPGRWSGKLPRRLPEGLDCPWRGSLSCGMHVDIGLFDLSLQAHMRIAVRSWVVDGIFYSLSWGASPTTHG